MIVIDASVLVLPFLGHDDRALAAQRRVAGAELAAPEIVDLEFVQAIRGLLLGGKITGVRAELALSRFGQMPIERFPHRSLISRVWQLRDNVTAYDAAYVALAESLGTTLVTGDVKLAAAPGIRCPVEVIR